MICPYCGEPAIWCENKEIYGKNYGKSWMCYLCKPCDAYVGCHNNTEKPLGIMANKELRAWRRQAHAAFDPLWKGNKNRSRGRTYELLAKELGKQIHIGESDIQTCQKVIEFSNKLKGNIC